MTIPILHFNFFKGEDEFRRPHAPMTTMPYVECIWHYNFSATCIQHGVAHVASVVTITLQTLQPAPTFGPMHALSFPYRPMAHQPKPCQVCYIRTKLLELDRLPFLDRNWVRKDATLTLLGWGGGVHGTYV